MSGIYWTVFPLLVVEPLNEHILVRSGLDPRPPSVLAAIPTHSARYPLSTLTQAAPVGGAHTEPCGSHGAAQLIREAGEVPRVRP
jgi:hypothetical protein